MAAQAVGAVGSAGSPAANTTRSGAVHAWVFLVWTPAPAMDSHRAAAHLLPTHPAGEKSLSVTIDEASENAVWNCFRAKCGMTGSTNVKPNTTKAYRQFTNTEGGRVLGSC